MEEQEIITSNDTNNNAENPFDPQLHASKVSSKFATGLISRSHTQLISRSHTRGNDQIIRDHTGLGHSIQSESAVINGH